MSENLPQHGRQFDVLNSFRGIGALIVAIYHLNLLLVSHFSAEGFLRHAPIMLDFFFILSGFVISFAYMNRLAEGYPVKDFIFRRFMRLYPVHAFTLLLFFGLECIKFFVPLGSPPFSSDYKTPESLIANIFLLQGLGFFDVLTWNGPSWSVSTEFFTYISFAAALVLFRKRIWIPCLILSLGVPLFMYPSFDMMELNLFVRCLYGFSTGVLAYHLYLFTRQHQGWKIHLPWLEFVTVFWTFAFLILAGGEYSLFSPFALMPGILVFAFEAGMLSRLAKKAPFMVMALLSYSIYMIHVFLYVCLFNVMKVVEGATDIDTIKIRPNGLGMETAMIDLGPWAGDLIYIIMLSLVIGASYFICRYIELPLYAWSKRKAKRIVNDVSPVTEAL